MFTMRKELGFNVQVAIYFAAINFTFGSSFKVNRACKTILTYQKFFYILPESTLRYFYILMKIFCKDNIITQ